jgi:hypothetical protein
LRMPRGPMFTTHAAFSIATHGSGMLQLPAWLAGNR